MTARPRKIGPIINLGLPKSGTTTLARAMRRAGLKVADWRLREADDPARPHVARQMFLGYYEMGDPLYFLRRYDALTEISLLTNTTSMWPQMNWGLLAAIRAHHPGALFVLTRRDPALHAQSMLNWSNLGTERLPMNNVPGLPREFGGTEAQLTRWIDGHTAFCRQVFRDDPGFLELDIAWDNAPAQLSDFLGINLPWWGHANRRNYGAAAGDEA